MYYIVSNELYHHGIKGQKWGVRRFQNADGSLKPAGEKRYDRIEKRFDRKLVRSSAYDNKIQKMRSDNRKLIADKWDKKIARTDQDAHSFDSIKNGLKDKKGRQILTSDDVASSVAALNSMSQKYKQQKEAVLKDFDADSEYVRAGAARYNQIIRNYKNAKLTALTQSGYKKSPEYRQAVKDYTKQVMQNIKYFGNANTTKLQYTVEAARDANRQN